jgi:outer membrane protein assembly factor BamA
MFVVLLFFHFIQGQVFAQISDEEALQLRKQRVPEANIAQRLVAVPTIAVKFPLFLASRGVKYTAIFIEEKALIPRTRDLLTSDDRLIALYPTASLGGRAGLSGELNFFNKRFPRKGNRLSLQAGFSTNSHQNHHIRYRIPEMFGLMHLDTRVRYHVKTNEDFFGPDGNDSLREERTNFRHEELGGELKVGASWAKWFRTRILVDYTDHVIEDGDRTYDSSLDRFNLQTTPGLDGAALLGAGGSLAYDTRDSDFYPSRGSLAEFSAIVFNQTDGDDYGFTRYKLELSHCLTLFRTGRILAVRLSGEINTRLSDDKDTPFFERASLGGATDLRGYSTGRFRDKDLILLNLEYRYPIWEAHLDREGAMDAVVFMDVGRVFNDLQEDTFSDYKTSYGIGIRARTVEEFIFRAEIARSEEETNLILKFEPMF